MNSVLRTCVNKFSRHEFGCVPGKHVRILRVFNQPHSGKGYYKLNTSWSVWYFVVSTLAGKVVFRFPMQE